MEIVVEKYKLPDRDCVLTRFKKTIKDCEIRDLAEIVLEQARARLLGVLP